VSESATVGTVYVSFDTETPLLVNRTATVPESPVFVIAKMLLAVVDAVKLYRITPGIAKAEPVAAAEGTTAGTSGLKTFVALILPAPLCFCLGCFFFWGFFFGAALGA
jgi:hypothetical protein